MDLKAQQPALGQKGDRKFMFPNEIDSSDSQNYNRSRDPVVSRSDSKEQDGEQSNQQPMPSDNQIRPSENNLNEKQSRTERIFKTGNNETIQTKSIHPSSNMNSKIEQKKSNSEQNRQFQVRSARAWSSSQSPNRKFESFRRFSEIKPIPKVISIEKDNAKVFQTYKSIEDQLNEGGANESEQKLKKFNTRSRTVSSPINFNSLQTDKKYPTKIGASIEAESHNRLHLQSPKTYSLITPKRTRGFSYSPSRTQDIMGLKSNFLSPRVPQSKGFELETSNRIGRGLLRNSIDLMFDPSKLIGGSTGRSNTLPSQNQKNRSQKNKETEINISIEPKQELSMEEMLKMFSSRVSAAAINVEPTIDLEEMSLYERCLYKRAVVEKRLEKLRLEKIVKQKAKESKELTFKPQINGQYQTMHGVRSSSRHRSQKETIAELSTRKTSPLKDQESLETTGRPEICRTSKKLSEQYVRKTSPVVFERLLWDNSEGNGVDKKKKRKEELNVFDFKPTLNKNTEEIIARKKKDFLVKNALSSPMNAKESTLSTPRRNLTPELERISGIKTSRRNVISPSHSSKKSIGFLTERAGKTLSKPARQDEFSNNQYMSMLTEVKKKVEDTTNSQETEEAQLEPVIRRVRNIQQSLDNLKAKIQSLSPENQRTDLKANGLRGDSPLGSSNFSNTKISPSNRQSDLQRDAREPQRSDAKSPPSMERRKESSERKIEDLFSNEGIKERSQPAISPKKLSGKMTRTSELVQNKDFVGPKRNLDSQLIKSAQVDSPIKMHRSSLPNAISSSQISTNLTKKSQKSNVESQKTKEILNSRKNNEKLQADSLKPKKLGHYSSDLRRATQPEFNNLIPENLASETSDNEDENRALRRSKQKKKDTLLSQKAAKQTEKTQLAYKKEKNATLRTEEHTASNTIKKPAGSDSGYLAQGKLKKGLPTDVTSNSNQTKVQTSSATPLRKATKEATILSLLKPLPVVNSSNSTFNNGSLTSRRHDPASESEDDLSYQKLPNQGDSSKEEVRLLSEGEEDKKFKPLGSPWTSSLEKPRAKDKSNEKMQSSQNKMRDLLRKGPDINSSDDSKIQLNYTDLESVMNNTSSNYTSQPFIDDHNKSKDSKDLQRSRNSDSHNRTPVNKNTTRPGQDILIINDQASSKQELNKPLSLGQNNLKNTSQTSNSKSEDVETVRKTSAQEVDQEEAEMSNESSNRFSMKRQSPHEHLERSRSQLLEEDFQESNGQAVENPLESHNNYLSELRDCEQSSNELGNPNILEYVRMKEEKMTEKDNLKHESFGGIHSGDGNGRSTMKLKGNVIHEVEEISNQSDEEEEQTGRFKKHSKKSSKNQPDGKCVASDTKRPNDKKIVSGKHDSEGQKNYAGMKAQAKLTGSQVEGKLKSHNLPASDESQSKMNSQEAVKNTAQFESLKSMALKAKEKYEELQSKGSFY